MSHPRLIFGSSSIGDECTTPEAVADLLKLLKPLGIKQIDAAAAYPINKIGASERLLGETGAAQQGFGIETKILVLSKDANGTIEPAKIEKSVDSSYERLQLHGQKINVLHIHAPDFTTPLKDQAFTLDTYHKKGIFDKARILGTTFAAVQFSFSDL